MPDCHRFRSAEQAPTNQKTFFTALAKEVRSALLTCNDAQTQDCVNETQHYGYLPIQDNQPNSTDRSTSHSTGHSINHSTDRSTDRSTGRSTGRSTDHSTGHSTDRSTDQLTIQLGIQFTIQLAIQMAIQITIQLAVQLAVQLTVQRAIQLAVQLTIPLTIPLTVQLAVKLTVQLDIQLTIPLTIKLASGRPSFHAAVSSFAAQASSHWFTEGDIRERLRRSNGNRPLLLTRVCTYTSAKLYTSSVRYTIFDLVSRQSV